MQKSWFVGLLILLLGCKSEVSYETKELPIVRANSNFKAAVELELLSKDFTTPLGVRIHSFGAFEVYWDGVRIGQNGVPAKAGSAEVPGTEASFYQVPDSLAALGKHVIEVTGTQSYLPEIDRGVVAKPESYLRLLRQPLIELSFVNLMAGAFLIASLYFTFLYYNSKEKQQTTLLFAGICFLFFALLGMEYLKFYIDIPYTAFYTRLKTVGWLTFAIAVLIPFYFIIYFKVPYRKVLMTVLVLALMGIYIRYYSYYDLTAHLYSLTLWIASVVVLGYAVVKKYKGSMLVLGGFLLSMAINQYIFYDFGLYIAFTLILICILYLQTLSAKQLEESHHSAQLLSSRLQLELVKKNMQPHFLRNTLTSLIDWVEESPKEGVKFIQALSEEFDIMNDISGHSLIPIQQEIELCKHHLAIMQFRKEIKYIWEDFGIQENEMIPPAVIHTLLENGITHSIPSADGSLRFVLTCSIQEATKQYVFEVFGENRNRERSGGNGFRYIEARLTENFGERWSFSSAPFKEGWRSIITLT